MNKLSPAFYVALANTNNSFDFFISLNTDTPSENQIQQLVDLGVSPFEGRVATAHQLTRDVIDKIQELDFVVYLAIATKLSPR